MGQKTHPTGFRVGIIQDWASTWYAKWKDYKTFVAEDAKIRKFVKKKLYAAGVSRILIARSKKYNNHSCNSKTWYSCWSWRTRY